MNWFKAGCYSFCFLLLVLVIGGLISQPVLAQSVLPAPDEYLKLESKYPALRGNAASTFEFEVGITYRSKEAREFRLSANAPEGFMVAIRPAYETKEISSIFLDANRTFPELIKVWASPIAFLYTEKQPSPGEYVITLNVVSTDGEFQDSIDLKIIVIAKYDMDVRTGGALQGRLNTKTTAGGDNHITMVITNVGTAPLEKLTFSSDKPAGWSITYEPNEIESIAVGTSREVDVNIKPPSKTISGDYEITLKVDVANKLAYDRLDIRVTVATSTMWAWVGIGIVVLVVAGLAVIFMRLSKR